MSFWIPFEKISEEDRSRVGGKAAALAMAIRGGLRVPPGGCVTTAAYDKTVSQPGFREMIEMRVHRKAFEDMRWEEIWDASLRIRNLFLKCELPGKVEDSLLSVFEKSFGQNPVVVRSSSPVEDSAETSFAGLHESYVNVMGAAEMLKHVRLVWASLWSDRALLYRQELGLSVERSSMAVVVQELEKGERSGVSFCVNPLDKSQGVVEAVHGLNAGLVDGLVEPDQWFVDRESQEILSHKAATREKAARASSEGYRLIDLEKSLRPVSPLSNPEVKDVYNLARRCEEIFGAPQDMEWTGREDLFFVLQSRPITSGGGDRGNDERNWYLTLTRSLENLKTLRTMIEQEMLPEMEAQADAMAKVQLEEISDKRLREEIDRRKKSYRNWLDQYWEFCIPFAHGMRLFGQVYNDKMAPDDPHEFVDLLSGEPLISLERNRRLQQLAERLGADPELPEHLLKSGKSNIAGVIREEIDEYLREFGEMPSNEEQREKAVDGLLRVLAQWKRNPKTINRTKDTEEMYERFLDHFEPSRRKEAEELLDLARASYSLRDNDNHYVGKIRYQLERAVHEADKRGLRLSEDDRQSVHQKRPGLASPPPPGAQPPPESSLRGKQFVGQPSSPGVATGPARVIHGREDAFQVQAGEVLVCDSIEPAMTFVVPLVSAIVERRGGMLIHGAIIAREYGLPCVTGVPGATDLIRTGQTVTVDGYLGLVTLMGT